MTEKVNGWPRELDRSGCLFGQHISGKVDEIVTKVEALRKTLEALRKTLNTLVISLATTSILLAANLISGYLTRTP